MGEGPDKQMLLDLITELKLEKNATIFVSRDTRPSLHSVSTLVLPLTPPSSFSASSCSEQVVRDGALFSGQQRQI